MIPVKVCGITNLEDALTCIRYGVTALGFVFAPSKRQVTPGTVSLIARQLPPFVTKVGVFVDEDPLVVREILTDCRLDLAQLHGAEPVKVTEILPGRVVKAFKAGIDPPDLSWKEAPLRAVLIDAYSPTAAGGSGITFDWNLFNNYRVLGWPLILAGGLHPGNVVQAAATVHPDALDLSSGVEASPGIKDSGKIRELMDNLRGVNIDGNK